MKRMIFVAMAATLLMMTFVSCEDSCNLPSKVTMSKDQLMDKIKGAWAGQTIGCTYGGPTEFWYNGVMIADSIEIRRSEERRVGKECRSRWSPYH